MRYGLVLSFLTASLFLSIGCGAPLPEEVDGSLQGQSESQLAWDDPIQGDWKSYGGWAMNICPCSNTGKVTVTPVACHPVGEVIFENITRTSANAGIYWYSATRYTGDGTPCGLRKTTVSIKVEGTTLTEYENGAMGRYWNR